MFDSAVLIADLKTLSSDEMQGRQIGTPGGQMAREFVIKRFKESGIQPFGGDFAQPFTAAGRAGDRQGINVVGQIEGRTRKDKFIVVSAHYDHIGVRGTTVNNGADDNASGTAALFAVAKYFSTHKPATSIIFAAFDGEEAGLLGSKAFVAKPPVPVESIVVNVNMDMIGREPNDRLFAVGVRFNPFLRPYIESVAAKAPVKLIIGHENPAGARNSSEEDWSGDSDHASFQRAKIPAIYLGVEDFEQHHRPTDDFETMSFDFYVRAVETSIALTMEFDVRALDILKARSESK